MVYVAALSESLRFSPVIISSLLRTVYAENPIPGEKTISAAKLFTAHTIGHL